MLTQCLSCSAVAMRSVHLLCWMMCVRQTRQIPGRWWRAAWCCSQNDHPTEALSALRIAIALGDTAPTTLLNLALAEQKNGDLAGALCRMEELERQIPDWDEPPLRIAEALRATDRNADAEAAYNRA